MEMQYVKNKIMAVLKKNLLLILYPLLAMVIEMTAVFVVEKTIWCSNALLALGLLMTCVGILWVLNNDRLRLYVGLGMLIVQAVVDIFFAVLFDMTGQYFMWEMLSLRNDAVAILEEIPLNFFVFYVSVLCCVVYCIVGSRKLHLEKYTKEDTTADVKKQTFHRKKKFAVLYRVGAIVLGIGVLVGSFFGYFPDTDNKYKTMVTGNATGVYASYGMIGNLLAEVGNVLRGDDYEMSDEEIESFIYAENSVSEKSPYFGICTDEAGKADNVVVILSESLEWFAFRNDEKYVNALPFTDELLEELYPNLTQFYNDSVVMDNFHSKEKTDLSETLSVLGSYPTGKFISYDYDTNVMPQTLPNILKITQGEEVQTRSFHNGDKVFYNRNVTHQSFGFESFTAREDMREMAGAQGETPVFTDWKEEVGEYNLDSEMMEVCKEEMFPKDRRFFTYITTITMHGKYNERETLQKEAQAVEEALSQVMSPEELELLKEDEERMRLFNYMVTAKEFDDAIGCMMKYLTDSGLLENTVIMLFGDHEAYYDELSTNVKEIDDYQTDKKFTDLYNVPLMIRSKKLLEKVQAEAPENKVIEKFVCTADLMPTLMDLLGIRYYSNMFYGRSAFVAQQSVAYSRGYGFFMSDGIVGRSVEGLVYQHADVTQAQVQAYKTEAIALVEKIRYCDEIFQQDYFSVEKNLHHFILKMRKLNGLT